MGKLLPYGFGFVCRVADVPAFDVESANLIATAKADVDLPKHLASRIDHF